MNKEQLDALKDDLTQSINLSISKEMVLLAKNASKIQADDLKLRMMALEEAGNFCRPIILDFISRMAGKIHIP